MAEVTKENNNLSLALCWYKNCSTDETEFDLWPLILLDALSYLSAAESCLNVTMS